MNAKGQEIVDLFREGPVFAPGGIPDDGTYWLTSDFETARAYWNSDIGYDDGDGGPWAQQWQQESLRLTGLIWGGLYAGVRHEQIVADKAVLQEVIKKRFRFTAFNDIWDIPHSDMCELLKLSYFDGAHSDFFEAILKVYQAGGWPFGWDTDHTTPRMRVFVPDVAIDDTNRLLLLKAKKRREAGG